MLNLSLVSRSLRLGLAVVVSCVGVLNAQPPTPTWERGPQVAYPLIAQRGTDGVVFASAVWDPDGAAGYQKPRLVIGGSFSRAGAGAIANVAMWDGSNWRPLGLGFNSAVQCLFVFNGELYAGGNFTASGSTVCRHIAKFDTATGFWVGVAGGFNDIVLALEAQNGFLCAAGAFTANASGSVAMSRIGRLNAGAWQAMPGGGVNGTILAMKSISNRLFVGGTFTLAGNASLPVRNLASWSSSLIWEDANGGTDGAVLCLGESGGRLLVGGNFARVRNNTINSPKFAMYLPGVPGLWLSAINFPGGNVHAVVGEEFAGPTDIYVGTEIAPNRSILYRYNGTTWTLVYQALGGNIDTIFTLNRFENQVVVGGDMPQLQGSLTLNNIARLNEFTQTLIEPFYPRWNGTIRAFAPFGGSLIAGGEMDQSLEDYSTVAGVVGWTHADIFGSYGIVRGPVHSLRSIGGIATLGSLYTGGTFGQAGFFTGMNNVATYSGLLGPGGPNDNWDAVPQGFASSVGTPVVRAFATFGGTINNPTVYAAGSFNTSGSTVVRNIARRSAGAWIALGAGVASTSGAEGVNALASFSGRLYATGTFDTADGLTANSFASYNGTAWATHGTGLRLAGVKGTGNALASFNGSLIVAGQFDNAGGIAVNNVAAWNGTAWSNFSAGVSSTQVGAALAVYNGELYLATNETVSFNTIVGRVHRWTGSSWTLVTGTTDNAIFALSSYRNKLHVGGAFKRAGSFETHRWAVINRFCLADVDDGSGFGVADGGVTIDDLLYYLAQFEAGSLIADVDNGFESGVPDGGVTIDDLLYFLQRFEQGC